MSTLTTYGGLNGHMLGLLMKELARRAIQRIQMRRMGFTEFAKASYHPEKADDLFTEADIEAQETYLKSLRECTPEFGIIGEENQLRVPCTHPHLDIYWTLDPVDGTRAFTRKQSHGIGTMLSLVCEGQVIGAIVGDVMTSELFYFRPDSNKVHRIYDFSTPEDLQIDSDKTLGEQYLLLRDPPEKYSNPFQRMAKIGDLFRSYQIADGSIGTMMARLWKGEVAAAALRPGPETPWDFCPVLGLSEHLGFIFLEARGDTWSDPLKIDPPKEIRPRESDLLIIHRSRLEEFRSWAA